MAIAIKPVVRDGIMSSCNCFAWENYPPSHSPSPVECLMQADHYHIDRCIYNFQWCCWRVRIGPGVELRLLMCRWHPWHCQPLLIPFRTIPSVHWTQATWQHLPGIRHARTYILGKAQGKNKGPCPCKDERNGWFLICFNVNVKSRQSPKCITNFIIEFYW